jgi:hypothetical protein
MAEKIASPQEELDEAEEEPKNVLSTWFFCCG